MTRFCAAMLAMAAAIVLTGCDKGKAGATGVYPLSVDQVLERLDSADVEGFRIARQCGILIHIAQASEGTNSITWRITSSGKPVARFTVTVTPEGSGARTTISVPQAEGGGEIYDGNQQYVRPAINQPLRPAVQELIDSAIEQRPYDVWRIPDPRNLDGVCSIQRGGLESGTRFSVDDKPSMTSAETAREREEEQARRDAENRNYGKPMMVPGDEY